MATSQEILRLLGGQIREARTAAELTQTQLGDRAGIVGKYVSEIERGTRDLPFSTLHAVVEHGLALRLEIQLTSTPRATSPAPPRAVPRAVADLAAELGELSPGHRRVVLGILRDAIKLTKR